MSGLINVEVLHAVLIYHQDPIFILAVNFCFLLDMALQCVVTAFSNCNMQVSPLIVEIQVVTFE